MIVVNRMRALAEIGRLQQMVARLAQVPRRTAVIAAPKLTMLLRAQFIDGTDPYGRPWAKLRSSTLRRHGPPPLTDTRRLRQSVKAQPARVGIQVLVGAAYGYFHQVGFRVGRRKVPARRILPQQGLPQAWRDVLESSARQAARQAIGGAR